MSEANIIGYATYDLKLGKFKPQYKGQMELYLKYMQKYDMLPGEESPIGLLLCSEGNTEHIELLMLDEDNIKVGQYLTCLPDKQWFIDKLNRSILIAQEYRKDYHLYGLTYDAPSSARLNTYEKKEIREEVLIVDPETPITREEYEKEQ